MNSVSRRGYEPTTRASRCRIDKVADNLPGSVEVQRRGINTARHIDSGKSPFIIEKGVQTGYHLRCTGLVISDDLPAAIDSQSAIIKYFRKGDIYRRHNSVVIQKTVITDSVVERSDDLTFVADSERHGAQGIRYIYRRKVPFLIEKAVTGVPV
jgi:hypothetical protein